MLKRKNFFCFSLSLIVGMSGFTSRPAAAEPDSTTGGVTEQLNNFEKKFFYQTYQHDPIEKRLQRLELLFFGATQGGTNLERWARVKEAIAERARQESGQGASAHGTPQSKQDLAPSQQAKYPVVATLENKICKQTFPNEPVDQRLSRLETKVFGQPAPGIPLADRVERLKKMVGAGGTPGLSAHSLQQNRRYGLGPMPKAQPRMPGALPDEPYVSPFGASPFGNSPFGGTIPFNSFGNEDMNEMNKLMNDMFSQLNRQLRELKKLPPGQQMDPFSPYVSPDGALPGFKTLPVPFKSFPGASKETELPPYTDPNSI